MHHASPTLESIASIQETKRPIADGLPECVCQPDIPVQCPAWSDSLAKFSLSGLAAGNVQEELGDISRSISTESFIS